MMDKLSAQAMAERDISAQLKAHGITPTQQRVEIAQILFAGLFTILGLVVVEHLLRPRPQKSSTIPAA